MFKLCSGFSVITASMLLVIFAGCKNNSYNPTSPTYSNAGSVTPSTHTVAMAGNTFSPSSLTVALHTTVTWNNNSSTAHTSTSDIAGKWNTGNIPAGSSAQTTFDSTGTFHYHCQYHPGMTGTITVQ